MISRQTVLIVCVTLWQILRNLMMSFVESWRTCTLRILSIGCIWTTTPKSNNLDTTKDKTYTMSIATTYFAKWSHKSTSDWTSHSISTQLQCFLCWLLILLMRVRRHKILSKRGMSNSIGMGSMARMMRRTRRMRSIWKRKRRRGMKRLFRRISVVMKMLEGVREGRMEVMRRWIRLSSRLVTRGRRRLKMSTRAASTSITNTKRPHKAPRSTTTPSTNWNNNPSVTSSTTSTISSSTMDPSSIKPII